MDSNAKELGAISCLMIGLFLGVNAMLKEERGDWLMWAILFLLGALLFWLWMMREQREAEVEADESLKAAEESLKRMEAKAAAQAEKPAAAKPAEAVPAPPAPKVEDAPKAEVKPAPTPKVEEAAKPAEAPKAAPAKASKSEPDDLSRIEGIGPKYAEILIAAGVDTYAKLAAMNEDSIVDMVKQGGGRKSASMATWAEQAKLAAAGDWDGLEKLQSQLSGGRK